MQEFESISASSYDPSALATKLTAKAAEGWTVVAIVPTGGDVTAYVSRESGAAAEPKAVEVVEHEAVVVEADALESFTPDPEPEPEPEPEPAEVESEATPEISEPSGWAVAPEPATPAPAAYTPTTTYQPSITPTPAATSPAPASVAPAAAARPAEPAATPAVPAGWYADPAGRFELRYWDGTTWTEHVSRTGQQFTDPPVA
jgi:Protein of unknown function (DUF2510)